MKKELKKKQGISLIVLVITIIIMIILAMAVIISLSSSNIIDKASKSKIENDFSSAKERKNVLESEIMLKKLEGIGNIEIDTEMVGNYEISYNESKSKLDIKYIETTVNGSEEMVRKAIIPDGFKHIEGTINTGLVISDSEENEFVWVPVDDYSKFKRTTNYEEIIEPSEKYIEPYTSGFVTESSEYNAMMQSVRENKGFYIARYEAGDGDAIEQRKAVTPAHKVVSKKGAWVYMWVPWGNTMENIEIFTKNNVDDVAGAVWLSKNMYENSPSVVSTLCYGVQWDATLSFISKSGNDTYPSNTKVGNYKGSPISANVTPNNPAKTGANENWKVNNIYDMAGNVFEWTMEAHEENELKERVLRGGCCTSNYNNWLFGASASYREKDVPNVAAFIAGFRVTLYVK